MFNIYQSIFGLKFEKIAAPLQMDRRSPALSRDRFRHRRAARDVLSRYVPARRKIQSLSPSLKSSAASFLLRWKYQRPTVALLCNFRRRAQTSPRCSRHTDVETLFHEFGHALHSIVTRAKYWALRRHTCARRFRRSASQMLQNWVWDKKCSTLSRPITATRRRKFRRRDHQQDE